jgi:ADP-heptose:LPS heptosyltransferase
LGSDEFKTYPFQFMANLIDSLIENYDLNILFNYIPSQKNQANEIYDLCNAKTQKHIYFNLIGNSIREFIAIMSKCDAIIGNDGGAINMAKALYKPSFIIFSPWIDKKGWATFEDGKTNISFHLKEFKPELFEGKNDKEIKSLYKELYQQFEPELISKQLINFIKINL